MSIQPKLLVPTDKNFRTNDRYWGRVYLMGESYLFDAHALIFWSLSQGVSDTLIEFFDQQAFDGNILVSSNSLII